MNPRFQTKHDPRRVRRALYAATAEMRRQGEYGFARDFITIARTCNSRGRLNARGWCEFKTAR